MRRMLAKDEGTVGEAHIEFFEHEAAPNEAILIVMRGGVTESQLTRKELLKLATLAIQAANKLRPS